MANIYSLQLLRNGNIFANYEAAVNAITGSSVQDGVIKLARYNGASTDSGNTKYSTNVVKTVFGIYAAMEGNSGWTVFDSYHEVIVDLQRQIDAMGGDSGSIAEQIQAAINALDYSDYTTGDSKVVVNVTETDGVVAATGQNIANIKLADYTKGDDAGKVAATDTLGEALSKLEKQVEVVSANTANVISGLDYTDTAVNGSYVSKVDEVDGVISVTREELPTVAAISEAGKPITAVSETLGAISATAGTIDAQYVTATGFTATNVQGILEEIDAAYKAADADIVGDATTSGNTLGKLEDRIEALDADAKEYSIKQITTGLSTNVKEAWGLFDADNNQSGATINIYKDSAYKEIYLGTSADTINATTGDITKQEGDKQSLNYAYMKADGTYDLVKVDVSAFLSESEFQSGVTAVDHIVRGVVDPTSENFLTVGADGFKLAGVQAAIAAASGDVKTKLDELSGKTVTGIDMTGGTAAITANTDGTKKITIDTDGSQILATGYAKGTDASAIAATDSINAALAKLENQVDAAKAAATTKVVEGTDAGNNLEIVPTTSSTDGSVTYTVNLTDVASASDLTDEIAARKAVDGQSGQTYAANTSANYISAATSLNDADVKLDAAIKALEGAAQTEIDAIETAVGLNNDGTYSANTSNTYTNNATSVADAVNKLDAAIKDNADDITELSGKTITGITMNGTGVTVTNNVAALTASYTNTAANSENGMVITTGNDGGLTFQFGILDCGEY